MWPDGAAPGPAGPGQSCSGSEVAVSEQILAAARIPLPANMYISQSPKTHIGPKIITQNIQNNEVVQGRFLGLALVSPLQTRSLRCSVAVFVCWALVVASGLGFYLFHISLHRQTRLDINLPLPQYLCMVVQNTTRAERVACFIAILLVIMCTVLIVYFTIFAQSVDKIVDVAPHEWNITREMWLARSYNMSEHISPEFEPLRLVIVQHTVSQDCPAFQNCAVQLRNLQSYFLDYSHYDIPYNFLIGNDGRVYEGRGWRVMGAHTKGYNRCSLGIGFIGDYRGEREVHSVVTDSQLNRTQMLLEAGVLRGYLHPDYVVVGAKDIQATASPGSNLYNAIRKWKHYDSNRYHNKTCEEIMAVPLGTDI